MNRRNWVIGSVLVGLALSSLAAAQPQRGERAAKHRERAEMRMERLSEFLGLTEEQEAAWQAIHEAQREAVRPLRVDMRSARQALGTELESEAPDTERLGQLLVELRQHREAMEALHEEAKEKLAAVLDADQQVRWEAYQEARGGEDRRGPSRRGPRGHRGPRGS